MGEVGTHFDYVNSSGKNEQSIIQCFSEHFEELQIELPRGWTVVHLYNLKLMIGRDLIYATCHVSCLTFQQFHVINISLYMYIIVRRPILMT